MMSLKKDPKSLIGKAYKEDKYNCWDFVEEVLDNVPPVEYIHNKISKATADNHAQYFIEITEPKKICIARLNETHVGIYVDGFIYHNDTNGVRAEPLRAISKRYKIRYYTV